MSVGVSIEEALKSTRYNEAAVVTIADKDNTSNTKEIVLVATLDETNGGILWQDATAAAAGNNGDGIDMGIVRHIRTKRWIVPMLQDTHRNNLYDMAIKKACQCAVDRLMQGIHESPPTRDDEDEDDDTEDGTLRILDIGSGTGLLAMIATKHSMVHAAQLSETELSSNRPRLIDVQVTSVEMASAMARLARLTIARNHLQTRITVVEGHSCHSNFTPFSSPITRKKGTKADICLSELLESGLLGEGIIPAVRDAWERHLKKGAMVVPQRARVYAQVLEGSECIACFRGPAVTSDKKDGGGGIRLCTSDDSRDVLLGTTRRRGDGEQTLVGGLGGILVPIHAEALLGTHGDDIYSLGKTPCEDEHHKPPTHAIPLTTPTCVLQFDFTSPTSLPSTPTSPSLHSYRQTLTPTKSGTAHGILFWWECDLWEGLTYSTKVGEGDWQDHWKQCLFVFGEAEEDLERLVEGEEFDLVTYHDDTSISFGIEGKELEGCHREVHGHDDSDRHRPSQSKRPRIEPHLLDLAPTTTTTLTTTTAKTTIDSTNVKINRHISSSRALQLSDPHRLKTITTAINTALQIKTHAAVLLDVSDFSTCAITAALAGATKVTSLEGSSGNLLELSRTVAQEGNGLPRKGAEFSIVNAHPESLTLDHICGGGGDGNRGGVDVIMAEPYYEILEGWPLQEALNYFHIVRSLKRRQIVKADAISVPSYACIMGCAVEFHPDVVNAHAEFSSMATAVGNEEEDGGITTTTTTTTKDSCTIVGFRHDDVKKYAKNFHTNDMVWNMMEYRWKRLSNDFQIAKIPYEGDAQSLSIDGNREWVESEFPSMGVCHAVVFWVDYGMRIGVGDKSSSSWTVMQAGDRHHRQAVRWLQDPTVVGSKDYKSTKLYVRPTFGNCEGLEDHTFDIEIR